MYPRAWLRPATVLERVGSVWTPISGAAVMIDIVPSGSPRVNYRDFPQVNQAPVSHLGYTDDIGPLDPLRPDKHHLGHKGREFRVLRIKDWEEGGYELHLDHVVGNA